MPIYSQIHSSIRQGNAESLNIIDEMIIEYNDIYIEVIECHERLNYSISQFIRIKGEDGYINEYNSIALIEEITSLVDTFYPIDKEVFTFSQKFSAIVGVNLFPEILPKRP